MKTMRNILLTLLLLAATTVSAQEQFWLGADISGTTELEAHGVKLYNNKGEIHENTALMKELGLNAVRLHFSETASLTRFFTRMKGINPSMYRKGR